jgi:hypothetical protein
MTASVGRAAALGDEERSFTSPAEPRDTLRPLPTLRRHPREGEDPCSQGLGRFARQPTRRKWIPGQARDDGERGAGGYPWNRAAKLCAAGGRWRSARFASMLGRISAIQGALSTTKPGPFWSSRNG